jgi:nucleoside-diphosphate-sugar epimerase
MNGASPEQSRQEPARVLVTGAGGFIGRHLVADQLRRGRTVVAFDRDVSALQGLSHPDLRVVEADVRAESRVRDAVSGVEVVFHLAAAHLSVRASASEYRQVNVDALRALIDISRSEGVGRFVHCSTVGVYGRLPSVPADEDTPCAPEFDYEKTKLEGEARLLDAHRSDGFPVVILRPAWVYGPGCPRTEKLFRAIAAGRFVVAGRGHRLRHSIYIRDAIRAMELAASVPGVEGQVLILADDRAQSIRTLVDEIAEVEGVRPPPAVPAPLLYLAGSGAELLFGLLGKEPPLSRRTLRFFSGNTSFRTERARRALGFVPRYSLRAGLEETARIRGLGEFWTVPIDDAVGVG